MSVITGSFTRNDQIKELDQLISTLEAWFKARSLKFNVKGSIIGQLRRSLEKNNLNIYEQSELALVAKKFSALNRLLERDIAIKSDSLKFSLGGSLEPENDGQGKYNDFLFEMALASRFVLSTQGSAQVNLTDICDVVVNGELAIECKYIHSLKSLKKRIKEGEAQIAQRIHDKQASRGYVAIDLSGLIDKEAFRRFCIFSFARAIRTPRKKDPFGGIIPIEETYRILQDKGFKTLVTQYISDAMKQIIQTTLGSEYQLKEGVDAIILQGNMVMPFRKGESGYIPVTMMGLTSYISPSTSAQQRESIHAEIAALTHALAV